MAQRGGFHTTRLPADRQSLAAHFGRSMFNGHAEPYLDDLASSLGGITPLTKTKFTGPEILELLNTALPCTWMRYDREAVAQILPVLVRNKKVRRQAMELFDAVDADGSLMLPCARGTFARTIAGPCCEQPKRKRRAFVKLPNHRKLVRLLEAAFPGLDMDWRRIANQLPSHRCKATGRRIVDDLMTAFGADPPPLAVVRTGVAGLIPNPHARLEAYMHLDRSYRS